MPVWNSNKKIYTKKKITWSEALKDLLHMIIKESNKRRIVYIYFPHQSRKKQQTSEPNSPKAEDQTRKLESQSHIHV